VPQSRSAANAPSSARASASSSAREATPIDTPTRDPGASGTDPEEQEIPYPSSGYAWYCVIILLGIYINSFLDRQILGLLVGPIRSTFGLSDAALGLLQGPAFAVLYAIAGFPLGFLADRTSRKVLIFLGQIVWSLGSVGFGVGNSFAQLFSARVVVGVGEATLSPSAYSMIADLFRPDRLARALSFYGMGIYIGGGLAYLLGGLAIGWLGVGTDRTYALPLVGEREPWQLVFFVVAAPTIPLSLLLLAIREPIRRGLRAARASVEPGVGGVASTSQGPVSFLTYLRGHKGTLLLHNFGFSALSFAGYGAASWNPEYFVRLHGMERAEVGFLLGWITLIFGPAGIYFGGWLGDRLTRLGYRDGKVRVGLVSSAVGVPFGVLYPLVPSQELAAVLLAGATFAASMNWGAAPAAIQEVVPVNLRGRASALYLFIINIVGLGLGPFILAVFTDFIFQDDNLIHYSLASVGLIANVLAAICLFACLGRFRRSMAERVAASH